MPRTDRWVELHDCRVVRETDKAMCVEYDGETLWLPISQVRDAWRLEIGSSGVTVEITEWIAKQKGIDCG